MTATGGQTGYPVIDLFAGPGGLGEGFSALQDDAGQVRFNSEASIERDEHSHQTLLLRHFLRCFPAGEAPSEYYKYLAGDIELTELYAGYPHQLNEARRTALRISLGAETHDEVRELLRRRLSGRKRWVLVGGPPCQAYSLVGRSRRMGDPKFEEDERHFLYREYLKIIVDHRPPVFVMENVKGLLSAKVDGEHVINRIVSDLSHPRSAVEGRENGLSYRLYSLSEEDAVEKEVDPRVFLVKAEKYGVPQARHRMFIVGVRGDLDVRPARLRPHDPPSVRQTIGNLPEIRSGVSRGRDSFDRWRKEIFAISELDLRSQLNGAPYAGRLATGIDVHLKANDLPQERSSMAYPSAPPDGHPALRSLSDRRLTALTAHDARSHMPSDLRRYLYAAMFAQVTEKTPKLGDFPIPLLPNHKNVDRGRSGEMFSDRFRVQLPGGVSTTVTSHISKDGHYFIHYDPRQCRSLTVREAARLQTFPDNYKFEGPRTSQYHQVGNAVPPYLASQIAEIVADVLDAIGGED